VGNALSRTTAYLAVAFFITSITLTLLATRGGPGGSIFDTVAPQQGAAPATNEPAEQGGSVLPKLPDAPQVPVSQ
jgi:preprotein translocase subunit SecG